MSLTAASPVTEADLDTLSRQLGRPVRDVVEIGARCVCGNPLVATTAPRLANGIPFPTTFYLSHPLATAACSRLEGAGVMAEMTEQLASDPKLADAYQQAHQAYISAREEIGVRAGVGAVPEISGVSAGGMPTRVKCLHALVGHALAAGEGVNPLGDAALEMMRDEFDPKVCRCEGAWNTEAPAPSGDRSRHTRRLAKAGTTNPMKFETNPDAPVAAIDCGTNSIRLLIAEFTEDGGLRDIVREMRVVRLGEDVDATGEFSQAALERTFAACEEYAELIREHGASTTRFVATSASRDVSNRDEFVAGVRARLNVTPEVVSGDEEARLSFAGASSVADTRNTVVVDLGGGSTEVVRSNAEGEVIAAESMNIGCVRFTERFLHSDPPTDAEVAAANEALDEIFDHLSTQVPLEGIEHVVGVAGTITTLTAAALELDSYDPQAIHGAQLDIATITNTASHITSMTREQRRALGYMHPGRADVIGAGALIWSRLLALFAETSGVTVATTSETDILDGIALSLRA